MSTINSDKILISRSNRIVFGFLSDFENFGKLMPEQVTDWKSTTDTCSFTISGMASLSMRMTLRQEFDKIVMSSEGKTPFAFELICNLSAVSDESTEAQLIFEADLSPMISMMASRPLQNFVNILINKLKDYTEKNL
jgi:hypothetical protein